MKSFSILILEDHSFQRSVAAAALRSDDRFNVLEAADGQEALDKLDAAGRVDIVICDLRMPGMDGLTFLRKAFEADRLNSVIISSEAETSLRQGVISMISALGIDFLGDLGKPFDGERLGKLIEKYTCRVQGQVKSSQYKLIPNATEVWRGLIDGEFKAYYQPKFDITNQKIVGAEVLARWQHPTYGLLAPNQFLPIVESFGLLDDMFWSLFYQGVGLQKEMLDHGDSVELAFNLDAKQLGSTTLTGDVQKIIRLHGLPAADLLFEVTENNFLNAPALSIENLCRLRLMGCGVAMDDFGAGYSSLLRLSKLPFNQIKLDKSFSLNLEDRPQNLAVIQSAVTLAQGLNISLIVEGVETLTQVKALRSAGVRFAQGYLFARPMPRSEFVELIRESRKRDQ